MKIVTEATNCVQNFDIEQWATIVEFLTNCATSGNTRSGEGAESIMRLLIPVKFVMKGGMETLGLIRLW